jgi:hypothetical protein
LLFPRGQRRGFSQQRPHPVAPDFGRGVEPAKGPDPGKSARQCVLEKTGHEIQRVQLHGSRVAALALAVVPTHFAIGQELDSAIGGGGFKDVTGKIAQRVLPRTRWLAVDHPAVFPHFGRHPGEELVALFLQQLFVERAFVVFDSRGKLLREVKHRYSSIEYISRSVTIVRRWYKPDETSVRFVNSSGTNLTEVIVERKDMSEIDLLSKNTHTDRARFSF